MSRVGAVASVAITAFALALILIWAWESATGSPTADGLFRLWVSLTLIYLIFAKSNRGDDR